MDYEDKRSIAARAEPLFQRIENSHFGEGDSPLEVDDVFKRWRSILSDSPMDLEERLEKASTNSQECRRAVSFQEWPREESLPNWISELEEILTFVIDYEEEGSHNLLLEKDGKVPFEDILLVLVKFSSKELEGKTLEYRNLSAEARKSAENWLLKRLSELMAQPLHLIFYSFMLEREPENSSSSGRRLYRRFIEYLREGGLERAFLLYPVMARLMVEIRNQWIDSMADFCRRIESDREELESRFEQEASTISEIKPERGDRHNRGRSVFEVEFESGLTVFYKPRRLDLESFFNNLLELINQKSDFCFKTPQIIQKGEYGWMEKAEFKEVDDRCLDRYYFEMGGLLCLSYLLNASDLHFDNLIASGPHPVLVDLETLFNPGLPLDFIPSYEAGDKALEKEIEQSVLKTGLLPFKTYFPDTTDPDFSALGVTEAQETSRKRLEWENINRDNMDFEYTNVEIAPRSNLPVKEGEYVLPKDFLSSILDGFRSVYNYMEGSPELLDLNKDEDGLESRFVFRATDEYRAILDTINNPFYLQNAVNRTVKLDELTTSLISKYPHKYGVLWPILQYERQALRCMDIPRFYKKVDGRDFRFSEDIVLKNFFDESGEAKATERIHGMGKKELNKQLDYIRAIFEKTNIQSISHRGKDESSI